VTAYMVHDDNGDHNLATGPSHHHLNMSEEEDPWNRNAVPGTGSQGPGVRGGSGRSNAPILNARTTYYSLSLKSSNETRFVDPCRSTQPIYLYTGEVLRRLEHTQTRLAIWW
jgi:hypothetical protein